MRNQKYPIRVAVYQPWIYQKGGMEKTILGITKKTSGFEFTIFTNHFDKKNTFPEFTQRNIKQINEVKMNRNFMELAKTALKIIKSKIDLSEYDLLLVSTGGFGEFITIRNHSIPVICYCHTPLRVIHDEKIKEKTLKEMGKIKGLFYAFEKIYKMFELISWKYFRTVVTNSLETKRRILNARIFDVKKILVIHPGTNLKQINPKKINKKYFLVAGRISELKSIELSIEAFKLMKTSGFKLVIAGNVSEKDGKYFEKLKNMAGNDKRIRFVLSPTNQALQKLYQNCTATLFTAKNEDWGIVPIESMANGKIVISVDEGGPTESIIDGKTGFLIKRNPVEFAKKMDYVAENPKILLKMFDDCINNAKKYDNEEFQKQILNIIKKTCE